MRLDDPIAMARCLALHAGIARATREDPEPFLDAARQAAARCTGMGDIFLERP